MADFSNSSFRLTASPQRLNAEEYLDQSDAVAMRPSGSWRPYDGSLSDLTATTNFAQSFSTTPDYEATSDQGDGRQERRLVCPFCGKVFSDRRNFYRHRMVHTNERPFQCPLCQYRSSRKSNVQRHMASRHHSPTDDNLDGLVVDDGSNSNVDQL